MAKHEEVRLPGFVVGSGYDRELALQSVEAGWASLINEVFDRLEEDKFPVRIIQIKEKWGGLRIYTDTYDEDIEQFLIDIEKRSFKVCEVCGEAGVLRSGGWYNTLCDAHANGRKPTRPF